MCEKCSTGTWTGFIDGLDCPGCGRTSRIGPEEEPLLPPREFSPEEIRQGRIELGLDPDTGKPLQ